MAGQAGGVRLKIRVRVRGCAVACLLLLGLPVLAAPGEPGTYRKGDYEFKVAPPAEWVHVRDVPATWDAAAPAAHGARWRNWLVDGQVDRRNGKRVVYFDRAYEPVSSELLKDAGKVQIWFSPDHQTLVIHQLKIRRDGIWHDRLVPDAITLARRESDFEHDMSNGLVSALIVLDDLRAGDVVRVSYTISGDNPVLAGLVDEEFFFAASDPILDRHARVLYDPGATLDEHRDRTAPESHTKRSAQMLEWSADRHATPETIDESTYPVWYDVVPYIVVGQRHSWSDIATWARNLYPPPAQPLPADLEQRIAEWRKLGSEEQRIAAALRAVQEDVRYFGAELGESTHRPSEPADTWTRRHGDCKDKARLLATVLGRMDIQAYPALVSINRGKSVGELPPAASLFDHVIVQARLHDTSLWLDATMTQQRGSPRGREPGQFGFALPVAPDARALVAVAPPAGAVDKLRVTEHLRPEIAEPVVHLQVDSDYSGGAADRMRRRLKSEGSDAVQRLFLDFYRKRYGSVAADTALAVSDDEEQNRLHVSEKYTLKNPWITNAPGEQAIEVYGDAVAGELTLPRTAERTAPLAVAYPVEVEQQTHLELPEGWRWLSQPSQRKFEDAAMTVEFNAQQNERTISMTEHLHTRSNVVEPGEYEKHFALLRDANELLGRRLLVGVSAREAAHQRDRRLENLMRDVLKDAHDKPAGEHR